MEAAGCDRRRLDAESIRYYLEANGHEIVADPARADRILAVVCAFKQKEEDESVRRLRSLRRYGRDILVYGCLADIAPGRYGEFSDLPSIAPRELETIDQHFEGVAVPFNEVRDANVYTRNGVNLFRVRRRVEVGSFGLRQELRDALRKRRFGRLGRGPARDEAVFNLLVCRGCVGLCSYCAIRRAIGGVRSRPVEDILVEFHRGLDEGYRIFNVLGDDPGCYGLDLSTSLPRLLGALFDAGGSREGRSHLQPKSSTSIRFHLREIHPKHLILYDRELLELPGLPLLQNILVPIQSGSDRVLQLMEREHSAGSLLQTLRRVRRRCPDVRLETQIIVGFPGETDPDAEKTLDCVRSAGFDSVVVFPYDDKEGTRASDCDDKIPPEEIQRRMRSAFRYFRRARIPAYYSCP